MFSCMGRPVSPRVFYGVKIWEYVFQKLDVWLRNIRQFIKLSSLCEDFQFIDDAAKVSFLVVWKTGEPV